MPVRLPDGTVVPVHDERAQRLLRLNQPLGLTCAGCTPSAINGAHVVHEAGCPEAHQDETRNCEWCASSFHPESRHHRFCCDSCHRAYAGLPDPDLNEED